MNRFFSLRIFSLGFAAAYTWAVIYNWPLFRYYPLVNRFSLTDLSADKTLGPGMSWFGWISVGVVGGLLASVLIAIAVPRRQLDRLWPGVYWLIPVAILIACAVREQEWFLQ